MTLPNFLYIGPDKSGSSWIFNILNQHAQAFVPAAKDIYYFDRYYHFGSVWYAKHFQSAKSSHLAIGEVCHDYLFSEVAAQRIKQDLPECKIITSLRHPVERSLSHYQYLLRSGEVQLDLPHALNKHLEILENSRYAKHLKKYLEYFDGSQVKILFFDDLAVDPHLFAKQLFEFLGIDFLEELPYTTRVREASAARSRLLSRSLRLGATAVRQLGLPNLVGKIKNSSWSHIFYKKLQDKQKVELPRELRQKLLHEFEADIREIEQITGRNLDAWRS